MRLGDVLRKWREASSFTLEEAGKRLGLPPNTLSRVERGSRMDGDTLSRIMKWLLEDVNVVS